MGFHPDWNEISNWIGRSERIFIKKLSRNDTSWADDRRKHQRGFYIPADIMASGYFPPLSDTVPEKPHIFFARYSTFWPASGEVKNSAIRHFTNKNSEVHHTRVPAEQFQSLSPASLLVSGLLRKPVSEANHWFVVIDSLSEEAEILETVFALDSDFHYGLFDPSAVVAPVSDADVLIAELLDALKNGTLAKFVRDQALPSSKDLASKAQATWLLEHKLGDMNPYNMAAPGDAVMSISRDIEYALYKQAEMRLRAAQAAQIILRDQGDLIGGIVNGFAELNAIFLSAAQTRKSRAGISFEHHVERLLRDGRIRHEAQAILGGRRPDFIMPTVKELNSKGDAMIVSLKTTLRERWKQLALEKQHGAIFLATVDDRVSTEAINDMQHNGIGLMVPESLKKATETDYEGHANVITFRQFFDDEVLTKRPSLIMSL